MDRGDNQPFKAIRERDIDFVLLEELTISTKFRRWYLHHLNPDIQVERFLGAWHSVSDSEWGESDIELGIVTTGGNQLLVMIENKIDAPFQDDQLQRYNHRGQKALEKDWDGFMTSLVAPENYHIDDDRKEPLDALVTYEALRDWFEQQNSERASFKARILTDAIKQQRRGYTAEPNERVTQLHRYYWSIARADYPELELDEPTGVPKGNLWIRFKIPHLPRDVKLRHKMGKGNVDIEFRNVQPNHFRERYGSQLAQEMEIVSSGKSMFVRINVPKITTDESPDDQEEKIRDGLTAARRLLEWYETVE